MKKILVRFYVGNAMKEDGFIDLWVDQNEDMNLMGSTAARTYAARSGAYEKAEEEWNQNMSEEDRLEFYGDLDTFIECRVAPYYLRHEIIDIDNDELIVLNELHSENLHLRFKEPFIILCSRNGYVYKNDLLGIYGYDTSLDDLIKSVEEDFIITWELYVEEDGTQLYPSALRLRQRMRDLLEKVE